MLSNFTRFEHFFWGILKLLTKWQPGSIQVAEEKMLSIQDKLLAGSDVATRTQSKKALTLIWQWTGANKDKDLQRTLYMSLAPLAPHSLQELFALVLSLDYPSTEGKEGKREELILNLKQGDWTGNYARKCKEAQRADLARVIIPRVTDGLKCPQCGDNAVKSQMGCSASRGGAKFGGVIYVCHSCKKRV